MKARARRGGGGDRQTDRKRIDTQTDRLSRPNLPIKEDRTKPELCLQNPRNQGRNAQNIYKTSQKSKNRNIFKFDLPARLQICNYDVLDAWTSAT